MNYQIKIIRTEPNSRYAEEMKEYGNPYGNRYDKITPQENIVKDVLICELNEEQFKKVKAEVLKVFE